MRRILVPLFAVALVAPLLIAAGTTSANAATFPTGFTDTLVAGGIASPTAVAFTPDNRILVTSQTGALRVVKNGTLLTTPAIDLTAQLCSNSERGLLGVAVDPEFANNHFVYLDYTHRSPSGCPTNTADMPHNRVSRFVLKNSNVIDPASEKVLIDNMPSYAGNHNGGDIKFGKDGFLYVSIGDSGCDYNGDSGCQDANDATRDQYTLVGKILRITRGGLIPSSNPYHTSTDDRCNVTGQTVPGHRCRETFAWGLRNPFRIAFDPNGDTTSFRIDDVGGGVWEEVDTGTIGADYGWNLREGHCVTGSSTDCPPPPFGMTDPIFDYNHSTGCHAITGGAFVPNGVWPAKWNDHYLFADYTCGMIWDLVPRTTRPGFKAVVFASGLAAGSGPIAMQFGPGGLYYTTYANGGEVRLISHQ